MKSELVELIDAHKSLEYIAVNGWGKKTDDIRIQNSNKGSFIKHDHRCLQKLNSINRDLKKITNSINGFLRTREIELLGCTYLDDCRDIYSGWRCGNLATDGGCLLKRDEIESKKII